MNTTNFDALSSEVEDCTRPWTFPDSSFDYIHLRWLIGSIPDWDALFAQAYTSCRPGGWVESLEPGCIFESDHVPIPEDSAMSQWGKFCIEGGKKMGRTFMVLDNGLQRKGMEAAGFVDVHEFNYKVRLAFSLTGIKSVFWLLIRFPCPVRSPSVPGQRIRGSRSLAPSGSLCLRRTLRVIFSLSRALWAGPGRRSRFMLLTSVARCDRKNTFRIIGERWFGAGSRKTPSNAGPGEYILGRRKTRVRLRVLFLVNKADYHRLSLLCSLYSLSRQYYH